jgi:alpha-L-fucosidase
LPLETSLTMNDSWGFNLTDHHYKSTRELIHYLVRAAGVGANLLLNIGPRPDGTIPPEAEERLREIGTWLERNGGAIYGTRAGPITPRSWGVTTQRGDTVFVHVLDWSDPTLALPSLGAGRWSAKSWPDGKALQVMPAAGGVTITVPAGESPDRIVALIRR